MRFWLAVMLIVCVSGFVVTSGTLSVQSGVMTLNTTALSHSIPVLVALAAPMVMMALVLSVTMALSRNGGRRRS